jgi:glycosyltransferase involved in cell wall biosynthesis
MKKVCFFGVYDPSYARTRVLTTGFLENGYEVVECRVPLDEARGLAKYRRLYAQYRKLRGTAFDHVVVAYPGHQVVWLARLLFGKRIVFDAFVSMFDSNVVDRKRYSPRDPRAWRDWLFDFLACHLAGRVLLDTNEHIDYFRRTFFVPRRKMIRVLVGNDEATFAPVAVEPYETFTVHFHGTYIPLHGIPYILEAAHLLREEDIHFQIIGSGQEYAAVQERAASLRLGEKVRFVPRVPVEELPRAIAPAHVCLGIFGDTPKTARVIPNKLYQCAAMNKAVITARTPAVAEVFTDEEDVVLCNAADGRDLAAKILMLRDDPERIRRIGENAGSLFQRKLTSRKLVAELLSSLEHS